MTILQEAIRHNSLTATAVVKINSDVVQEGNDSTTKQNTKFTTTQKLSLVMLAAVEFMSFCSMSIMAPFYPKEASAKGMSETMAGFVFSFYALVMFISSPVFGKILPRLGVKSTYVVGIFISGIMNCIFGTIHHIDDYYWFTISSFVFRGIEALGTSAYSNAVFVLILEIFPHNGGAVRGLMETCVGLGLSVGPALGGLLFSVSHHLGVVFAPSSIITIFRKIGGFGLPFYVIGVGMILLGPLNMIVIPKIENQPSNKTDGSFRTIIKIPQVLIVCAIIVVVSITWSFLDPTLEPHLRKFDLNAGKIGLIFLLLSAMYGIFSPGWGWLADKLKHYQFLMPLGLLFSFVSLLFLGPSPIFVSLQDSLWMNVASLSALGIFVAMALMPTFQGLVDGALEGGFGDSLHTQSLISGIWSCAYSLGEVIGPALGGALLENCDFPTTATTMAAINLVTGIVSGVYFLNRKRVHVKCEEKGAQENDSSSVQTSSNNEFSIFTVEDKLVARSGSICKIEN